MSPPSSFIFLLALLVSTWPLADAAQAAPVDLATLEAQATDAAPEVRLAQAERTVIDRRRDAAAARAGTRLSASANVGDAVEATSDTSRRNYQRIGAQIGLRVPLLGSREAEQRLQLELGSAAELGELRASMARAQAMTSLRSAYVEHAVVAEQIAYTEAFLAWHSEASQVLSERRRAGLLLEADRLGFDSAFTTARATLARLQLRQAVSRATLGRLTARPQPEVTTDLPAWEFGCVDGSQLQRMALQQPAVVRAQAELRARRQLSEGSSFEHIDAGATLSHGQSRDIGGLSGHATTLGVDVSIPLNLTGARDASRAQRMAEADLAAAVLDQRLQEQMSSAELAWQTWQLRLSDETAASLRLSPAIETFRVARLKAQTLEGDNYERLLQARLVLFQASLDLGETRLRRWQSAAEMRGMTEACAMDQAAPQRIDPSAPSAREALRQLQMERHSNATLTGAARPTLDWFVWDAQALLTHPERLNNLPSGTRRVLLSLTAAQLADAAQAQSDTPLRQLLHTARQRQLRVDLLLGEPSWVLPAQHGALLALVQRARPLGFDGVALDLERSQLPQADQPQWPSHTIALLKVVRAHTALPLALVTHHREFDDTRFVAQLTALGLDEAMPMLYIANRQRVAQRAEQLMRRGPGLRWSVAQSIEPSLSAAESMHQAGRGQALQHWRTLARQLAQAPQFDAVVVQSLSHFLQASP